jgi:excisionase family DNA binding protein
MSVKTIYSWIATGEMEAVRIGKRSLRIPREEIIKKQKPAIE